MVFNIIGWYGTETMGDIAILDGIIDVLSSIDEKCDIFIGSLYPFYSERTLLLNYDMFKLFHPEVSIKIYDIKSKNNRKKVFKESDMLLIGGGPLMGIYDLYFIEHCFEEARKLNVSCVVMGCGIGPINTNEYEVVLKKILKLSTAISCRDEVSTKWARKYAKPDVEIKNLGDPAIISIEKYKMHENVGTIKDKYLALNLREYPEWEYGKKSYLSNEKVQYMLKSLLEKYHHIEMVPMHTFSIGGDDRMYYSRLFSKMRFDGVHVIQKPQNLHELYRTFSEAEGCIGMRYHSIVMQTILNGNNIILDYTDSANGKISGFLSSVDKNGFYLDRKLSIYNEIENVFFDGLVNKLSLNEKFRYNGSNMKCQYVNFIKRNI